MEKIWHAKKLEAIQKELRADFESGLSAEEVEVRKKEYGTNAPPEGHVVRWWELFFSQFNNPLVLILIAAAVVTFIIKERVDTLVIGLAVVINVVIGFIQEYRSSSIFKKLRLLASVTARVKRDGGWIEVEAKELVPGDIILIHGGTKIPADARLIREDDLTVNESLLTGESLPSRKQIEPLSEETPLADRSNMIFTGTAAERGEAEAVIVETGSKTELGQIAALTASVDEAKTPLQERLSRLGRTISLMVLISVMLMLAVGIFEQRNFVELFIVAVAVAVAAIPEGLPAALTVVFAVASKKILNRKGLVKTLLGTETLGSTTVICTDKTGTLTEGNMKVESIHEAESKEKIARALALANEAVVGKDAIHGEVTDKAKLAYFIDQGGDLAAVLRDEPRVAFIPFDQDSKHIASFHARKDGTIHLYVTGAPEILLGISTKSADEQLRLRVVIDKLASDGYRLIGAAEKIIPKGLDVKKHAMLTDTLHDLSFLGITAIHDPIRKDVKESIEETRKAGVRTIMMTGDHLLTAIAIGKELGFGKSREGVISGNELDAMSESELESRVRILEIIARATPKHKMQIINALRAQNEVVAMTGDGVNDAPALKAADVGISLGSGTDITKDASDLVLLDDSFSTITAAIREGRIAFDNIRKVTVFLLANSFTEFILVLTTLILRIPILPLTAVQILWANLVEDGLPNFALAFEPGDKKIMRRKPFARSEPILDREGMGLVFVVGVLTDLLLVGAFLILYYSNTFSVAYIQTVIFAAVATDSLIYVFSIKSLKESVFSADIFNNKYLLFATIAGFFAVVASVYAPPLNTLLGTIPLDILGIGIVAASGFARLFFIELGKWLFREKKERLAAA